MEAKEELLYTMWDRMVISLDKRSKSLKDYEVNELIVKIKCIPKAIKNEVLRTYIKRCRLVHCIAFL